MILSMTTTTKQRVTGTNLSALSRLIVENRGTVPARVHASSQRHVQRCVYAGLLARDEKGAWAPTAKGWDAIAAEQWHATHREALAFRPGAKPAAPAIHTWELYPDENCLFRGGR
jgi:hypothetical protein